MWKHRKKNQKCGFCQEIPASRYRTASHLSYILNKSINQPVSIFLYALRHFFFFFAPTRRITAHVKISISRAVLLTKTIISSLRTVLMQPLKRGCGLIKSSTTAKRRGQLRWLMERRVRLWGFSLPPNKAGLSLQIRTGMNNFNFSFRL